VVHVAFDSLLADLVGKKLGNFLGRPCFKNLDGSQDHGLVREITSVKTNCLEVKIPPYLKEGR
jgi:hypothetical protein